MNNGKKGKKESVGGGRKNVRKNLCEGNKCRFKKKYIYYDVIPNLIYGRVGETGIFGFFFFIKLNTKLVLKQ